MTEVIGDVIMPVEIVLPSITTTQRDAMANKAGILIFNSTTGKLNFNTGSGWEAVTSA